MKMRAYTIGQLWKKYVWEDVANEHKKRGAKTPPLKSLQRVVELTVASTTTTTAEKPFPKTFGLAFDLSSFLKHLHVVSPNLKWSA